MSHITNNLEPIKLAIRRALTIAVDTETDGLNTRKNTIIGLGISTNRGDSFYVTDYDVMKEVTKELIGKRLIFWNAYFDLEMIKNCLGMDLWESLYCDVVLLKHTVDEEQPFKLKEVAAQILGADAKAEQEELAESIKAAGGVKGEVWKGDPEIIAKYCMQDCKLTYQLYLHYIAILNKEKLNKFFFEDEVMPLYKNVTRVMQSNGIPVDLELLQKLKSEITPDIETLRISIMKQLEESGSLDSFKTWFCNKNFRPLRTGPFAQACIELSGLKIPKLGTGKFSLARSKLLSFIHQSDYIKYIVGDIQLQDTDIKKVQQLLWSKEIEPFNLSSKLHLKKSIF